VADATGSTVWRWDQQEPFGDSPANENPGGAGSFDLPLRLPGQYFEAESGLNYNYYRDYDAATGRYLESDPIGLKGGLNTYAYVASDTLRFVDPEGREVRLICRPVQGPIGLFFDHCFVHVTCPQKGWQLTLSLFGTHPWLASTGYKVKKFGNGYDPLSPDSPNSPSNNYNQVIVPILSSSACACDYEKSVVQRFNSAPPSLPYYGLAFNSNTFAGYLLKSSKYGTNLPGNVPFNAIGLH